MAGWISWPVDAPDKPFLTAAEVAELFGYDSETSVNALIDAGQLPAPLKRGGKRVWSREDVVLCGLLIKVWDRMQPKTAQTGPKPRETDQ
jgi:predicted DNA-binding transcriptional regulator AlpA